MICRSRDVEGQARGHGRTILYTSAAGRPAFMTPQIEAFLEMMSVERDASPHTLSAYRRDLEEADRETGGLMQADTDALEAWYADLSRRGLSAATASRRRSAARQFYRFVLSEGWRTDDPSRRLEAPKRGRPRNETPPPPASR